MSKFQFLDTKIYLIKKKHVLLPVTDDSFFNYNFLIRLKINKLGIN